jgi:hypothetical protein
MSPGGSSRKFSRRFLPKKRCRKTWVFAATGPFRWGEESIICLYQSTRERKRCRTPDDCGNGYPEGLAVTMRDYRP